MSIKITFISQRDYVNASQSRFQQFRPFWKPLVWDLLHLDACWQIRWGVLNQFNVINKDILIHRKDDHQRHHNQVNCGHDSDTAKILSWRQSRTGFVWICGMHTLQMKTWKDQCILSPQTWTMDTRMFFFFNARSREYFQVHVWIMTPSFRKSRHLPFWWLIREITLKLQPECLTIPFISNPCFNWL